jgi:hypothetical protein
LPPAAAKKLLTSDETQTPPILPTYIDLNGKLDKDILIENPRPAKKDLSVKTGAAARRDKNPLDEELRKERIFGNRRPVQAENPPEVKDGVTTRPERSEPRNTGAVTRPVFKPDDRDESKQTRTPIRTPRTDLPPRTDDEKSGAEEEKRNERRPVYRPKTREENQTPPIYVPPQPRRKKSGAKLPRRVRSSPSRAKNSPGRALSLAGSRSRKASRKASRSRNENRLRLSSSARRKRTDSNKTIKKEKITIASPFFDYAYLARLKVFANKNRPGRPDFHRSEARLRVPSDAFVLR